MENNKFNIRSYTQKIPEIRHDLQIIPIQENGRKLFYFHDAMSYISPNFALDASVHPLLSMFSGAFNAEQISHQLNGAVGKSDILKFVQLLDNHRVLNSRYFRNYAEKTETEFEKKSDRPPALAGQSYPDDPARLSAYLDEIFQKAPVFQKKTGIKALYAPHIDVEIGKKQYAEAFSHLKPLKPGKVIILATAHYTGHHDDFYEGVPFIGSNKTFHIPGRSFETNSDIFKELQNGADDIGFTLSDRAHRVEHSIELHLLFASAVWKHDFSIVPILVGGFDELYYHQSGDLASKINRFTTKLKSLIDDNTFILISGDLSHVGKKFGDAESANALREKTECFDRQFLNFSAQGNAGDLLSLISENYDETRVCGFAPLYSFLNMFPALQGEQLNYHWWDERERESAVSFGSILY